MILHDFRCDSCGHVEEHFVPKETVLVPCTECGVGLSYRVILSAAKLHWAALAQGKYAGTTAIDRFERVHAQQKAKEEKSWKEHGDYGPAPGGAGGSRNLDGSSISAPFKNKT